MPSEWRRSTLIPIYKNKRDIQNCTNYRGIKRMSHYETLGRVIKHKLRYETKNIGESIWFNARETCH
jgi:hypothetical protein